MVSVPDAYKVEVIRKNDCPVSIETTINSEFYKEMTAQQMAEYRTIQELQLKKLDFLVKLQNESRRLTDEAEAKDRDKCEKRRRLIFRGILALVFLVPVICSSRIIREQLQNDLDLGKSILLLALILAINLVPYLVARLCLQASISEWD